MTQNELEQLAGLIQGRISGQGSGVPTVQRPKELDDIATPPDTRAKLLEAYTGALLDKPQSTWSSLERDAVREQVQVVLKGMNR
jgi:hypothetical protein